MHLCCMCMCVRPCSCMKSFYTVPATAHVSVHLTPQKVEPDVGSNFADPDKSLTDHFSRPLVVITCAVLDVRHASGPTSAPQSPLDRLLSNRQHATRALHHAAVGLALWWTDVALVVAHIASQSSSPAHLAPAPRPRDARLLLRPAPPHGGDDLLRQAAAAPPEGRPPLWTDADGRRPFRHALWRWHRGGDP